MVPTVIAYCVASGGNLADEGGVACGVAANEEERGTDVLAGENVEELRSPVGVRAVVVGEREFAGLVRRDQCGTEDLRGGPERGVGERAPCEASGC